MAATNEPMLADALSALQRQEYDDFQANVVVDHADSESWAACQRFATDERFHFTMSPVMQGLARVWNGGIVSDLGNFLLLTGGETVLQRDFLTVGVSYLREHDCILLGTAGLENVPGPAYEWNYLMRRSCARAVGPLDYAMGPGGLGTIGDWFMRAHHAGYDAVQMFGLNVPRSNYSIQDKAERIDIEAGDVYRARWGAHPEFHPCGLAQVYR